VLPALAVTLGGFGGVRFFVDYVLRPHYLPPLQATAALGSQPIPAHGSFWTISTGFLGPAGQHLDALRFTPGTMPAACQALVAEVKNPDGITRCLGAHGFRTVTSYQPANRFWTFQGIETLIYLAIAAVLVFVTFQLVRRRDA
jgi:hypothetical protein